MLKALLSSACALLLSLGVSLSAQANWYLDGESSRLSFITTQNANIADVHRFLVLHGKVDRKGLAQLRIEMDSVNSSVPLRDERMRDVLFDFKHFPEAQISAQIDLQPINDLASGAQLELRLPVTVSLRGKQHTYQAELLATRLDERRFQVVTLEPLMLQAEDFGLQPELETLRKLAGLSAISFSVPVNAVLIFTAR
ncbi:YceI family protein [Pseudomonas sp. FSL R10-0056]|uniref:YceI family protein n=1 Tax=unclassified Pseudomonas TaxID=196821 RepID=UPI001297AFE3|nr:MULTISPECIES: YceI family protein [unclassified Pseudomonas]MDN5391795.1 YceI family protein [Pseudomonas sp.]MDN5394734.1 YceI family protein [Pseudomonas sp.]MDN5406673.1 YceI family protein [Pseudomonas sp.]MDN5455734.1 YceI family protein [Pseudomonas sp.]MDN5460259.1 YceI family protein [Pseudomonas sp.]